MRIRDLLMFVLGTAVGGAGVFYLSPPRELVFPHVQAAPETFRLLVAKRKLNYGAILRPKDLQWVEWPENVVPPGAFTSVEELLGEKGDQTRIVLRSIEPGEPVLESKINKITKFGESPRMSMNLSAGMRAVSIKIDAVSGVAGFIKAGDRVDILLTRTQAGQLVTSVILEDIAVIVVDQSDNAESSSPRLGRMVTVEVDTTQAQKLALARQVGKLSMTLRGIGGPPRMLPNPNDGMRAVTISIDEVSGVAGFVAAGDRVDILLTTRTQQGQLVSSVILQNVSVLAAGPVDDSKPRAVRTVTLAVTTTQAQTLAVAQQVGKLSLTLRDTDQRPNRAPGASGFLPPGVAAPRRPRQNTISDFPITPGVFPGYDEP